ncbi:MAG: hypothetical protein IPN77_32875 [Sandaracinaceae bacterium]|nr:hypothetical protein [Sandaracinaceae bacterium]
MFTAQGLRRALLSLLLISFSPLAQACGSSEAGSPEGPSGGAVPSTPSVPAVAEGADTPDPTAADPAPAAAAVEPAAEAVDGGAAAAEAPAAPAVARAHGPLAPEVRAHFEAMRPDPAPRAIIRSSHYYRTNELSHWVYRERVANVGGVMSGVGSDQLYLLAGWARPEILVPLDFDGEITATHRVVAAVFLAHATPEAFMAAFDEANVDALEALVRAHYASSPDVDSLARTARNAGRHLFESMRMIRRRYTERGVPTYITDAAQYEFVRGLVAEGRVFPIRGDLTADLAMLDLALAARRANLPRAPALRVQRRDVLRVRPHLPPQHHGAALRRPLGAAAHVPLEPAAPRRRAQLPLQHRERAARHPHDAALVHRQRAHPAGA